MKRVFAVLVSLVFLATAAIACAADDQKASQPQEKPMMMDHQMMKGGKGMMDCQMMKGDGDKGMMKHGMMKHHHKMMHDMMQMMKEMMAIQKKMLSGASQADKAKMEKDLASMMEKMDKMMSSSQCMMMHSQMPAGDEQKKDEPAPMEHKH